MKEVVNPIEEIDPPLSLISIAVLPTPTKGAYPDPSLDPKEIMIPPLGSWFWLTSASDLTMNPFVEVIPLNTTLVIPRTALSTTLKLFPVLFCVDGVWKILLIKIIPLPPVDPMPVVLIPFNVKI